MKSFLNINTYKATILSIVVLVATFFITGCEDLELPGANSKPDTIPPDADFSYASDPNDFTIINFTNLSTEALNFMWDFGDGNTSTDKDPVFTFAEEGTYPVTLTATDGLGVTSAITIDVEVAPGPYQPIILEAGFEDGQLEGGSGDGRDSWRNSDLGGVIQITGSPVVSGSQGAKLPGAGDIRIGYQEIVVDPETNYDISFIYTMFAEPTGYITVDILGVTENGGTFTSHEDTQDHVVGSVTVNDQEDPEVYVGASLSFNSGANDVIAIYFYNDGITESRLDDFTIEIGRAGAVPPSASFTAAQSETDYLEYAFKNNSKNADSYLWDFGDGNTSTEENPTHLYSEAGEYTVILTSSSEGGLTADFSSSIDIQAPAEASFEVEEISSTEYKFTSTSTGVGISLYWEFGDGYGFDGDTNPINHTYSSAGFYTVTLTATSETGFESVATYTLAAGLPKVVNGDFEDSDGTSKNDWKPSLGFTGGEGNSDPYSGSSDGAFQLYDGTDTESKTRGAKIDGSRCAVDATGTADPGNTRYAYQSMTLDPNTEYYLEFSYNNASGTIVAGEILDGHFADGSDAYAASLDGSSLVEIQGTADNGEDIGNSWRTIRAKFTSNASGEVSIWMWAFGGQSYYDNVKILPAWVVESGD